MAFVYAAALFVLLLMISNVKFLRIVIVADEADILVVI